MLSQRYKLVFHLVKRRLLQRFREDTPYLSIFIMQQYFLRRVLPFFFILQYFYIQLNKYLVGYKTSNIFRPVLTIFNIQFNRENVSKVKRCAIN